MNPPIAKRLPVHRQIHGINIIDDYGWLKAENWSDCVDDPSQLPGDIKAYLDSENKWCSAQMANTQTLQQQLLKEMKGRIQADDISLPDEEGVWSYVERYQGDEEHSSYWRYARLSEFSEATAEELIDFNIEAEGREYFDPGDVEYSPTHTHLAWSADVTGAERYTVFIRNMATGQDEDTISNVESIAWGDGRTLFYTHLNQDHRPNKVFRHELGTDVVNDVLVFEEEDARFYCSVWASLSGKYIFISSDMNDQSEVWILATDNVTGSPVLMEPRAEGVEYSVEHQGDRFLIRTNADDALDFKIMQAPCDNPSRQYWVDWLPHQSGRMVLDHYAYKYWVMWMERENALPRICFKHNDSPDIQRINFDEEAYALSLEPMLEFDECLFHYGYESPSTPSRTYSFSMSSGERVLLKKDVIPSGHDPDKYVVLRRYATSADGESVPLTVLHHKDTLLDGSSPCWLTGYGAYGSSTPADFGTNRLSLVDRGFIYAIAHVRGGQEKGRAWYEASRLGGKPKSIDDLIAVGEYLVDQSLTSRGRIVIAGGSAGGLLVGAALNRNSDLWGAAIADVPFVDVLNTMLDDSLPLTPGEWSQWGNPIEDKQAFLDIKGYSPYDNVQPREYPPMLVTAGVSDPRVTYWEPAKWVAKHRHLRADTQMLLLKTNMHSGHFGETGRYASLADVAHEQAFAIKVMDRLP